MGAMLMNEHFYDFLTPVPLAHSVGGGVGWVSGFAGRLPVGWWLRLLVAFATNGFLGDY